MGGFTNRTGAGRVEENEMVLRYAHLSPNHKLKAIESLAAKNFTTGFTTPALAVEGEKV
jgi:hypothetical protein